MKNLPDPLILQKTRLIVFDMAGTTVRDQKEVEGCFDKAAKATGLLMTAEEITAVQGWSKEYVFRTFWSRQLATDNIKAEAEAQNSYAVFREILEAHYENVPDVLPTEGCMELLKYLHQQQVKVALTTGFYRKVCDIILERMGWKSMLDATYTGNPSSLISFSICSDEVEHGRPAPDMIFKAMSTLAITDAATVINFGDTPSDLESGKRAGISLSLGLNNGTHTDDQLKGLANDGIFSSLAEFHLVFANARS